MKQHTLNNLTVCFCGLGFLNCDNAVRGYLFPTNSIRPSSSARALFIACFMLPSTLSWSSRAFVAEGICYWDYSMRLWKNQ